jgi:acetoin utilization protein AcuB
MNRNVRSKPTTVGSVMTAGQHSIGASQTLELAALHMAKLRVGHLPVLEAGQPVGMLSERDIEVIKSVLPGQVARITVEEAMSGVPYCVTPDTLVAEAARHMAVRKLGSALVVEHGQAVGVFTTTDALALLAELLETNAQDVQSALPAHDSAPIGPLGMRHGARAASRQHARR